MEMKGVKVKPCCLWSSCFRAHHNQRGAAGPAVHLEVQGGLFLVNLLLLIYKKLRCEPTFSPVLTKPLKASEEEETNPWLLEISIASTLRQVCPRRCLNSCCFLVLFVFPPTRPGSWYALSHRCPLALQERVQHTRYSPLEEVLDNQSPPRPGSLSSHTANPPHLSSSSRCSGSAGGS